MSIQSLGYMGVRSRNLEDWAGYGPRQLGMQRVDKSRSTVAFRMDDRKQRLIVNEHDSDGIGFFGWEVADKTALTELAGRLDAAGVKVARGTPTLADERHVADLIVFQDPIGNRLEAFYGGGTAADPVVPGRSSQRTGKRTNATQVRASGGTSGHGRRTMSIKRPAKCATPTRPRACARPYR